MPLVIIFITLFEIKLIKSNMNLIPCLKKDRAIEVCPLSEFINSLNTSKQVKKLKSEKEFDVIIDSEKKYEAKDLFSQLQANYNSVINYKENIRTQCCFYLNYWLDEQKEKKKETINDSGWTVIEKLWDTLKSSSFSCDRKPYKNLSVDKDKCVDFMAYCVNKDELKYKCEHPDQEQFKENYCKIFNAFTEKYYKEFIVNGKCLNETNNYNKYYWTFSDNCSLHNAPKTFPKYTSDTGILDDESKASIGKCENGEKSLIPDCYMFQGVPVKIEELPSFIDKALMKYGIYAGSSFIGFLSLALYLYKVKNLFR
ncbi:hypothetical protein PVNG_05500 [Plasmodium vivax North Korean]|uniref:Uncharacterized protein n=1 Tax=Plasmodium vivax North Korean TaxID=1035514 RepID=A0A0J9WFC3_PLAVI|nr:hypothetical protein PVNG_05500 [Plasmodium vivax North Korean]